MVSLLAMASYRAMSSGDTSFHRLEISLPSSWNDILPWGCFFFLFDEDDFPPPPAAAASAEALLLTSLDPPSLDSSAWPSGCRSLSARIRNLSSEKKKLYAVFARFGFDHFVLFRGADFASSPVPIPKAAAPPAAAALPVLPLAPEASAAAAATEDIASIIVEHWGFILPRTTTMRTG